MPSTRSSTRGNTNSSPASVKSAAGNKRKADGTPEGKATKRGKAAKGQLTLEETIDEKPTDEKAKDAKPEDTNEPQSNADQAPSTNGHANESSEAKKEDATQENKQDEAQEKAGADVTMTDAQADTDATNALDKVKAQEGEAGKTTKEEDNKAEEADKVSGDAIQEDKKREEAVPSNILEKGVVYFFTRGRVGTDDPNSVQDLARSYFVLRPLPTGAKITEGSIQDAKTSRLLALPKKVWPKSGRDRFMVFVEKAKADMKSLKEEFFQGSEYSTKTTGTRQTPPVTPIGEGVYAITRTGGGQGTTHLAYILTIPSTISEVQKDLGLAEKGSFVVSLKNPEASGPANAALPEKPDWPKEYIEEFSGRSWMPAHPKHLDYANAQILLIGEDFESSNNLEPKPEDEKDDKKETPAEELEKLGEEDEHRIDALKGDDSIFADLGLSSKDYPKVMTTCENNISAHLSLSRIQHTITKVAEQEWNISQSDQLCSHNRNLLPLQPPSIACKRSE